MAENVFRLFEEYPTSFPDLKPVHSISETVMIVCSRDPRGTRAAILLGELLERLHAKGVMDNDDVLDLLHREFVISPEPVS